MFYEFGKVIVPAGALQMPYKIEGLRIGPEKNFCYLIYDSPTPREVPHATVKTGDTSAFLSAEAALIDGAYEFDKLDGWISSFNTANVKLELKYLLTTHGHQDHAGGLNKMKEKFPRAKIAAHEAEAARLAKAGILLDLSLRDNEELSLGRGTIRLWHTPGHTEGGCCYVVDHEVITGDTLFVGQCGRTDMAGGSDELLFQSLQRLKSLPGDTVVRPGHDYGDRPQSTISHEMQTNPTMKVKTVHEFIALP